VIIAAGLAAAVWAYQRVVDRGIDDFWALCAGVALPVLALGSPWLLREGVRQCRDLRALERPHVGEPLREGGWVGIAGVARASNRPYQETLSGQPALASTYRVTEKISRPTRKGQRNARSQRRYSGWHMVPTVIDTQTRSVRLRAFPDLFALVMSTQGASNVGRLAEKATAPPWSVTNAAQVGLLTEVRDELHLDWKLGEADENGRIEIREWVLRPEEPVCVCGPMVNGALVPSRAHPDGLPLYPGTRQQVLAMLRGASRVYLGLGASALASVVGLGTWLLR
jgi:hypothetical protein